jgi:protein SDA1
VQINAMVQEAMVKHGLKSASAKRRLKEKLYCIAEDTLDAQEASQTAPQQRLDPHSLLSGRHGKREKADRMASVMAGRADREGFGSSVARKKRKTGGLSNIQKQKQKVAPAGAAKQRTANRKLRQKHRNNPRHHQGRASHAAYD